MTDLPTILQAIANVNDALASEPTPLMDILAAVETEYAAIIDDQDTT